MADPRELVTSLVDAGTELEQRTVIETFLLRSLLTLHPGCTEAEVLYHVRCGQDATTTQWVNQVVRYLDCREQDDEHCTSHH